MTSQPVKPAWTWALTVLGAVAIVLATGRCGPTVVGPAPDELAYRQMAIVMDGGGGPPPPPGGGMDGGGSPGDAGGGSGGDAGSGGDGGSGLCSQFTICNTDADCVGNPAGPTCTPCPACGKHCWTGGSGGGPPGGGGGGNDGGAPDGGNCTKCVCIWGVCYYNSDCPTGSSCNTTTNKCMDGGTEFPTKKKAACEEWLADAGASCDLKQIVPMGGNYGPDGCNKMNVQYFGHSSQDQCTPDITAAFFLCTQGCSVSWCNNGCNTFNNQAQAEATFQQCRDMLDLLGFDYDVTITGNQALSCPGYTTHMTLSCTSGGPTTVTYAACDPAQECFFVGERSKCTRDGGVLDQVCCAKGPGDPIWTPGTRTCPLRPCSELTGGGTCWGENNPTTSACTKPDGGASQVVCCGADGGAKWIENGRWKDSCN